jgi:hypothetical protein
MAAPPFRYFFVAFVAFFTGAAFGFSTVVNP